MSNRQNVIDNLDTVKPALPAGWWSSMSRRTVLLGMVFGISGALLLATNYDSVANQLNTGLQLSAQTPDTPTKIESAKREPLEGSELMRLILTPRAVERLNIQTAPLGEAEVAYKRAAPAPADPASLNDPPGSLLPPPAEGSATMQTMQKVVPYSALLYDTHGKTWVYKRPEPLTFVRHQVEVDYIEGDVVVLSDGPATGTSVVTMGAGELYGTEYKLGH